MNEQFRELVDMLAEQSGSPRGSISTKTRIYEDLRIQGADWNDVLEEINKRWNVSWTEFEVKDYIRDEPNLFYPPNEFERWISGKKMKVLTVGHLAEVIEKGAWFEPQSGAV